ncbi:MAG TPA: hypothetical protein VG101_04845 [Puia sp.]|nr:hypothetical protein [Puia sp.]
MIFLYLFNTVVPILLLLLLSSFIHVLVHELGHALPVLATPHSCATVYVGSFGDRRQSIGLRLGRLKIWIKYNPFLWFRGMCQPGGASFSINQQICYLLAGPLASILLGVLACLLLQIEVLPGFLRFWLGFLVLFAAFGLLGSTFPAGRRRYTVDGTPVYPDLILAFRLWRSKRLI